MSRFPPISVVVPHQEPMVLLDRLLDWTPGQVECALIVRAGARFVEDGLLAAPFTIEHMAQAGRLSELRNLSCLQLAQISYVSPSHHPDKTAQNDA